MPTQREAWLVDLDDAGARTEGDLCNRHATALVLPRGWALHDERTRVENEPDDIPVPKRSTRPRRRPLVAVPARRTFRHPELELELATDVAREEVAPEAIEAIEVSDTIIEVETAIVLEPGPEPSVELVFEAAPEVDAEVEVEEKREAELELEPELEPEPEPDVEDEDEAAEPEATAAPEPPADVAPQPERSTHLPTPEGLADVLDARTPLLRRAFQNVWPLDEPTDED